MTDVSNKNFLSPLNFKFLLKRAPHVNFFIQRVNLPGLALPNLEVGNPLISAPYAGDHLRYDELTISFRVDEDLQNYMELHTWLRALGKRDYREYKSIASAPKVTGNGISSDISLTLLTSNKNPNYEIVFRDAFPISVSGIDFTTMAEDVDYIEASASFRYLMYDINKVS